MKEQAPVERPRRVPMSGKDKGRRLAITMVVVGCVGALALAVSRSPEINAEGDVVPEEDDFSDVEFSGDEDSLAEVPPPPDPDQAPIEDIVEQRFPTPDSEILRQQQIGIDLTTRYTASLVLNGVVIPDDQLVLRPELGQVFFQPGEGQVVEEYPAGRNCLDALVRVVIDGSFARTVSWCFQVT